MGDSVKQGASKTSYETNKGQRFEYSIIQKHGANSDTAVAKDSDAPIGTRVRAAGDAISDKVDEKQNKVWWDS